MAAWLPTEPSSSTTPAQLAAVFQQFARADVAGDEDRVFRHLGPGVLALAGQDAQQAVREVVKIVQPFAQVGVGHLFQPGAGGGLFFFDRRLGGQAAHRCPLPSGAASRANWRTSGRPRAPASGPCPALARRQQVIDRHAQLAHRSAEAVDLGQRVVGDGVGDDDARFVQPDAALGGAFLSGSPPRNIDRLLVQRPTSPSPRRRRRQVRSSRPAPWPRLRAHRSRRRRTGGRPWTARPARPAFRRPAGSERRGKRNKISSPVSGM